jgi:3',5'-cyclic AMP phosphodiesterase CpdA
MPMVPAPRPAGSSQRLGRRLFTFAVIADTHVNQEEGKASSDFAVNRLSNARNRFVIHEINRAAPAFVLHLGDIVHPTPIHPGYATAAASFHALAGELECPLHLTPGNHDVGDKPGDWLPVPSVNDDFLALYRHHFGRNFYSFDANDCHFVVIDAQVINSGLQCEGEQQRWLEEDLAQHASRRTFLCTHYPPYLFDRAEESHYDNIDEPGRSWLLDLLTRHGIEAVFAGHVHNFWYHLHGQTEIYLLPSTAFVRLDYSELFRIGPAPERGRNDAPKLGYFMVDVHERGHVAHALRTFGAELAPGATLDHTTGRVAPIHTKTIARAPVGIDMRYPWAEKVEVAASGAMDEFCRKAARNDYPLLSLWEMGIRRLRVPLGDLANPQHPRAHAGAAAGRTHVYRVYAGPAGHDAAQRTGGQHSPG